MKILIVTSSLPNGGKERQIIELSKGLLEKKIDFKIVSFSASNYVEGLDTFIDSFIVIDRNKGLLKSFLKYVKLINAYRPSAIHSWDHLSTFLSVIPKLIFRLKLIDGSIRGAKTLAIRKKFMFFTKPFSDFIIANSFAGLESARLKPNKKNIVIYNGIDIKRFEHLSRLENNYQKIISIGMIANLRPAKDYLTFNKVVAELVRKYNNITFTSIGDGFLEEESANFLSELRPDEKSRVLYLGKKQNTEEYINKFDICLLLSDPKYGAEGISNSIMEYMSLGKPVIATNTGGTPEIIRDGESGFLVNPYDYKEIISKIEFLINNIDIALKIGNEGKNIINHKFNLNQMVDNYLRIYNR